MIEGKVISRFKFILHKVEGAKDQENVNASNINIEPYNPTSNRP